VASAAATIVACGFALGDTVARTLGRTIARTRGARIVENPSVNPFPAPFQILVRDQADVVPMAKRFFGTPIVDNAPGSHNGVQYTREDDS